jgi:hypothetical protein
MRNACSCPHRTPAPAASHRGRTSQTRSLYPRRSAGPSSVNELRHGEPSFMEGSRPDSRLSRAPGNRPQGGARAA